MTEPTKARGRRATDGIRRFFEYIGGDPTRGVSLLVVTHLLPDRPFLIEQLQRTFTLRRLYPKPKSASPSVLKQLRGAGLDVQIKPREYFASAAFCDELTQLIEDDSVILLDIGGYFATALAPLSERLGNRLLGVVEDTENGLQRYEAALRVGGLQCPVVSVAHSPLKETEDYLVGQAVIHSAEHLIRLGGQVLGGKSAVVFGFGKVGRSAAINLRARGVEVRVIDTNQIRQVQALSLGFQTTDKADALAHSDLIVGATGARCLENQDWFGIKPGAFIFTVTSSDDELDTAVLQDRSSFVPDELPGPTHTTLYSTDETYFYLLNAGNAVNFLHNAVVGDFIYLVQGEIVRGARLLADRTGVITDRILEVDNTSRRDIASAWLRYIRR